MQQIDNNETRNVVSEKVLTFSTTLSKKLIILYVLIIIILITFLAAVITIIAKQFAKKISLEGYTAVPN